MIPATTASDIKTAQNMPQNTSFLGCSNLVRWDKECIAAGSAHEIRSRAGRSGKIIQGSYYYVAIKKSGP
jgi:hypothetical protein